MAQKMLSAVTEMVQRVVMRKNSNSVDSILAKRRAKTIAAIQATQLSPEEKRMILNALEQSTGPHPNHNYTLNTPAEAECISSEVYRYANDIVAVELGYNNNTLYHIKVSDTDNVRLLNTLLTYDGQLPYHHRRLHNKPRWVDVAKTLVAIQATQLSPEEKRMILNALEQSTGPYTRFCVNGQTRSEETYYYPNPNDTQMDYHSLDWSMKMEYHENGKHNKLHRIDLSANVENRRGRYTFIIDQDGFIKPFLKISKS